MPMISTFGAGSARGFGMGVGSSYDTFELITSNTSTFTEGNTTHTFPSGIEAGDLLVMMQSNAMQTVDGYGPAIGSLSFGTGFTQANDGSFGNSQYYQSYYQPSQYSVGNLTVSYKVAAGTESGASIGGFETPSNVRGSPYGTRLVFVFRPSFTHSSSVTVDFINVRNTTGGSTVASHTISVSRTPSASLPSCGVVFFSSPGSSKTASLSGGLSTFDSSSSTSSGSFIHQSIFRGGFVCLKGTSEITATGPANTTAVDQVQIYTFTLS
jgi:hypothetical protein